MCTSACGRSKAVPGVLGQVGTIDFHHGALWTACIAHLSEDSTSGVSFSEHDINLLGFNLNEKRVSQKKIATSPISNRRK